MSRHHEVPVATVVDHALRTGAAEIVVGAGAAVRLPVHRWTADATTLDHHLLVRRCYGPTLDVGCGPGRIAAALAHRRVSALGIDVSAEAVRRTCLRGGHAVRTDVFDVVPHTGRWDHVVLADGNIGIGGDPVRLLRRVHDLLGADGSVLIELEPYVAGIRRTQLRLRAGGMTTAPFPWARVGADALGVVAAASGFVVADAVQADGRHVTRLVAER